MKRTFGQYLFFASVLFFIFSLPSCRQAGEFTGTPTQVDLSDVQVKFQDGQFYSVYKAGSSRFTLPTVSSKQTVATVKIVVGSPEVNVKIKGKKVHSQGNEALEFVRKINLSTGSNIIPFLIYRGDESAGDKFEVVIDRKAAEGALRLTHLKCSYKNYTGGDVESDDFVDELPFNTVNGVYKKQFATDDEVLLEVGSPELDRQLVQANGATVDAMGAGSAEYKTYKIKLNPTSDVPVDITVYDSNKGKSETFHLMFAALSEKQRKSTDIESVFLTCEDGEVYDFEKLDMTPLSPYVKGDVAGKPVNIENIFKCREIVFATFDVVKPTLSVVSKEPGAKVQLFGFWEERDHVNFAGSGKGSNWSTNVKFDDYDIFFRSVCPVLKGPDSDREFKFTPYNQMKFNLLFKVTSPDGTVSKYHEIKYNFPFEGVRIFLIDKFQAVVKRGAIQNGKKAKDEHRAVIVKEDPNDDELYNIYLPVDAKSVKLMSADHLHYNVATNSLSDYDKIAGYRFYLSVDDEPYARSHLPDKTDGNGNYKELVLTSPSGVEEHVFNVVSYQDGVLKDGKFVDEYGKESGVSKLEWKFRLRFIKEDRKIAPALSVLKIEGEQDVKTVSAVQNKIWPTISFRPSIHEYKVPLVEDGITYKLKMLKTDATSKIFVDGVELQTKETFTQKKKVVDDDYMSELDDLDDDNVEFFSYELKRNDPRYYEGGKLKASTIKIGVKKADHYREYSLEIEPVNPSENDLTIHVVNSNFGSYRSGVPIYYKEHEPTKELRVTGEGKFYKGDFRFLGTTGSDGTLSGKGELKAGVYYDIYALGNDAGLADSFIEHYYVSGAAGERLDIVQVDLLQSAGSDYKSNGKPIRGNCPVRLKKQVKVRPTTSRPAENHPGSYFFFRQRIPITHDNPGPFILTPVNLSYGDAHIKMMRGKGVAAQTDFVTWFDVSSGNSVEPVLWGPDGVMMAFDTVPTKYSNQFVMTNYNPNGQIGMESTATTDQESKHWDFSSGVYDLVIVAYDVAGNRLERHQLVSIEHSRMMLGSHIGDDNDKPERQIKVEDFRVITFRWPRRVDAFANKDKFERLFGMPWTEYTPPSDQGDKIKEPTACLTLARASLGDAFGFPVQGCDLYRRCVEDNTPFKKVGSGIPPKPTYSFPVIDVDYSLEEGKTYQYKMVIFVDEGQSIETDYLVEVKIPPSFMYFLDSIEVSGQGAGIRDGEMYKYNVNGKDKNIPLLKKKKYSSDVPKKDRKQLEIDYKAKLTSSKLWSKDYADYVNFGITLATRDANSIFASKCIVVFNDDGSEEMLLFVPTAGTYVPLSVLVERGLVDKDTRMQDLISFDKATSILTVKDAYLRLPITNWAQLFGDDGSFEYEAGNTYYWDIVVYGRAPYGDNVSALEFTSNLYAKKKDAPSEKYLDEDGEQVFAGFCSNTGNTDTGDGNNAINGKCRFTVVEE